MSRNAAYRDPVAEQVIGPEAALSLKRTLRAALGSLDRNLVRAALLRHFGLMTVEQIADELGLSSEEAQRRLRQADREMSGYAQRFRDEFEDLDEALRFIDYVDDSKLRQRVSGAHLEPAQAPKNKCLGCSNSLPAGTAVAGVGRPRRNCSNTCRQRAYRRRARLSGPSPVRESIHREME